MTASTTTTSDRRTIDLAAAGPAPVSLADALAMRLGLALLLWGRRHAVAPRRRRLDVVHERLAGDARWYMH